MKPIVIQEQPRLSFSRTVWIAVDGIRYRLFRAVVTVAVIGVAVAFLMNILSESFIKRAVAANTRDRIARSRLVHQWAARLMAPGDAEGVLRELAADAPGAAAEAVRFGGLAAEELESLRATARLSVRLLDFLESLNYARRRQLVHAHVGVDVLGYVATPDGGRSFMETLDRTAAIRLPFPREDLQALMAGWPAARGQVDRILTGRRAAVARLANALGGRSILEALAEAEGAFGGEIRAAGFAFDAEVTAAEVAAQARREMDTRWVERALDVRVARQMVAQHFDALPGDVTVLQLWRFLGSESNAARFLDAMKGAGERREGLTPERIVELANRRREATALERAARLTVGVGGGWMGLGERLSWLLLVSMLVCAIGISNAMLMTVTERFREIATLKCLGALDGFIMLMFVLESCMLGIVGGVAGGLLGAAIGMGRMLAAFGGIAGGAMPWADLGVGVAASIGVGVLLAAVAAVYPSFRAARLAPMEAMRVE